MSDLIKISEASTMGIHAMVYLAANPDRVVPLKEIAERLAVSENHLAKVFQRLGKADVVKATRGPSGGYMLAHKPEKTTLLEVYEALEGAIKPKFCLFGDPVCLNKCCGLGELIGKQNKELRDFLAKTRIADAKNIFSKRSKS